MTQRDNILQELNGLKSKLGNIPFQNIYTVPNGYFEGLANQILNRIRALHAENVKVELDYLSPELNNISKQIPYSIPDGYFNSLEERLMNVVRKSEDYQTAKEELEAISPFLNRLNKQMPYSIPHEYFEKANEKNFIQLNRDPETKIVSIFHRNWFRYAAAAVIIVLVSLGGLLFENRPSVDPNKNPDEWVAKNVKKVSNDKLDDFIKLADEESSTKEQTANKDEKTDEIKELLKDVPDSQIQEFLNETAALGNSDAGDKTSLN